MIPFQELVTALASWRTRQGLPMASPEFADPLASETGAVMREAALDLSDVDIALDGSMELVDDAAMAEDVAAHSFMGVEDFESEPEPMRPQPPAPAFHGAPAGEPMQQLSSLEEPEEIDATNLAGPYADSYADGYATSYDQVDDPFGERAGQASQINEEATFAAPLLNASGYEPPAPPAYSNQPYAAEPEPLDAPPPLEDLDMDFGTPGAPAPEYRPGVQFEHTQAYGGSADAYGANADYGAQPQEPVYDGGQDFSFGFSEEEPAVDEYANNHIGDTQAYYAEQVDPYAAGGHAPDPQQGYHPPPYQESGYPADPGHAQDPQQGYHPPPYQESGYPADPGYAQDPQQGYHPYQQPLEDEHIGTADTQGYPNHRYAPGAPPLPDDPSGEHEPS